MQSFKLQLHEVGYAFLENYQSDRTTEQVAVSLGRILQMPDLQTTQTLRPRQNEDSAANSYSGNFGLGRFPLHSDLAHWYLPPHYLMLRCIYPATGVYTSVMSTSVAIETLSPSVARRALFRPRKQIGGRLPLLRFLQSNQRQSLLRWDQLFLVPANSEAEEVSMSVKKANRRSDYAKIYLNHPGDILIVDNWMMLHGRGEVPQEQLQRKIERIYLMEIV